MAEDRSGEILGGAIAGAGRSIGDFMKQRAEENKALKRDADIVDFLAKKDPSLFGEGFDIFSLSVKQKANLLGGIKESVALASSGAFVDQTKLTREKWEQGQAEAQAWNNEPIRYNNGIGVDARGNTYRKGIGDEDIPLDKWTNYINSLVQAGMKGSDIQAFLLRKEQQGGGVDTPPATVIDIPTTGGGMAQVPSSQAQQAIAQMTADKGSMPAWMQTLGVGSAYTTPGAILQGASRLSKPIPSALERMWTPVREEGIGAFLSPLYDIPTGGERYMAIKPKEQKKIAKKIEDQMTPDQLATLAQLLAAGGRTVKGGGQAQAAAPAAQGSGNKERVRL
jgi:hypothetical protein